VAKRLSKKFYFRTNKSGFVVAWLVASMIQIVLVIGFVFFMLYAIFAEGLDGTAKSILGVVVAVYGFSAGEQEENNAVD
jgi:ABC-type Co2+ transport system permease subunit